MNNAKIFLAFAPFVISLASNGNFTLAQDVSDPVEVFRGVEKPVCRVIWRNRKVSEDFLYLVNGLGSLVHEMDLSDSSVSGEDLKKLEKTSSLVSLSLDRCKNLGDDDLLTIPNIEKLESLSVAGGNVTSEGISKLSEKSKEMKKSGGTLKLKTLLVSGPTYTDQNIKIFAEFANLETLSLVGTGVTEKGIAELKTLNPKIVAKGYFPK